MSKNTNIFDQQSSNYYSWPCQHNEHTDRHNNPYFNIIRYGEDIPNAEDDYSEDSNANSCYKEHDKINLIK